MMCFLYLCKNEIKFNHYGLTIFNRKKISNSIC